jgi:hypothetical protein
MQRAQSDDKFRHADLRSDPLILKAADNAVAGFFMHQSGWMAQWMARRFSPISSRCWFRN